MSTVTRIDASGIVGQVKRLKTFATYPADRELLQKLSDLLSLARGRNYPEREVFVSALESYAAHDVLSEAEALVDAQIAEIEAEAGADASRTARRVEMLRAAFEAARSDLLATCERQEIAVEEPKPRGRKR